MRITSLHKTIYRLFIIFFSFISVLSNAQNVVNEYSNFECSHSKLITLPLTAPSAKKPIVINQIVFYEHRDQFSYWYKVVVNEDGLIDCKISPINNNDNYVLYVYKYKKEDFCNKVFYGKIDPLKATSFLNNKANKEAFEMSD